MNISGEIMVFKNEYGYSTSISNKNQNGEYDKMYLNVHLPRGVELENRTKINITKGFLSFYKNKQGLPQIKVVVMEYQTSEETQEREAIQNEQNYNYDFGDDLPF